jgi:type IV secretion system protein VirD4
MLRCGRVLAWLIPTSTGFQIATQMIAATWSYHPALGAPWLTLGAVQLYTPWQWLLWLWRYQGQAPDVFTWPLRIAASGALLGLLCAVALTLWAQRGQSRRETTYGSARWSSTADVKRSGLLR